MVDVTAETAESLEETAENNDVEHDLLLEKFKEKYNELQERSDWSDEKVEKMALRTARSKAVKQSRTPSSHIEMLAIGGDVREGRNGDYFNGTALVDTDPDSEEGRPQLGEIIVNEEHLLEDMYQAFSQVGNVVEGEFSVSEGDLDNHLRVFQVDNTEVEYSRPDNREPLYNEIRELVPETDIESIADDLSGQTRSDDGDMYTISSDVRRIEGDIYDGYKNPEEGNGTYTIRDDTVFDEEDIVDSSVHNSESANENATPGLTCWTDPNKMEFGSGSVCEFIGTLTTSDDGEVMMNVDGIIPILTEEYDGYTDESSSDSATAGDEQVDTSNVSRQEI